jgi:hypothetical protein
MILLSVVGSGSAAVGCSTRGWAGRGRRIRELVGKPSPFGSPCSCEPPDHRAAVSPAFRQWLHRPGRASPRRPERARVDAASRRSLLARRSSGAPPERRLVGRCSDSHEAEAWRHWSVRAARVQRLSGARRGRHARAVTGPGASPAGLACAAAPPGAPAACALGGLACGIPPAGSSTTPAA